VQFAGMMAIGLFVGLLIGLTGLGSGSLLTPLLILAGGLSPATAVGTSLAFSFTSKFYGSWNFYRRGMVQMDIVRDLSIGSLPGALVGAFFIRYLGLREPGKMDFVLFRAIGAALIVVAFIMIARLLPLAMRPAAMDRTLPVSENMRRGLIILAGFGVGASVTVTSIGSGAALIPAMILFYKLDSGTLVGTNVFMGTILAGVAGISHMGLGHVDWQAVVGLLCGSVPALWFATRLHGRIPRQIPEGIIAAALLAMGVHIMFL
jgi:uncharacterized membrane protein YfcA